MRRSALQAEFTGTQPKTSSPSRSLDLKFSRTATAPKAPGERDQDGEQERRANLCARCEKPCNTPPLPSGRRWCSACARMAISFVAQLRQVGQRWQRTFPIMFDAKQWGPRAKR